MKRLLLPSKTFTSRAKTVLKKHRQRAADLRETLDLLATDCFHPRLKTHKLKAELEGCWACSAGYDLRIVFKFVVHEGAEAILLQTMGTHEEVY
ncbi:MAG: type II toxin-antitoxin system YafQ family toxin [Terriglobia bacterium]